MLLSTSRRLTLTRLTVKLAVLHRLTTLDCCISLKHGRWRSIDSRLRNRRRGCPSLISLVSRNKALGLVEAVAILLLGRAIPAEEAGGLLGKGKRSAEI